MARKRKQETITQKYNKYAIGLEYFGESASQKKRASKKELREIIKQYQKVRRIQREMGVTDLPNISQIYKYALEDSLLPKLEPLPYADEPLDLTKHEYPVIEEFYNACERVLEDARVKYVWNEKALSTIMDEVTRLRELFDTIYSEFGRNNQDFAQWLANSDEFEQFKYLEFQDSDGAQGISTMENFSSELEALYNSYKEYQSQQPNSTYIAPTDIHFDV